jgi:hypothetical protein
MCQWDWIRLPRKETFLNAYKVLSLNMLSSKKRKEPFKSLIGLSGLPIKLSNLGLTLDPTCLRWKAPETMEHLFSMWQLLSQDLGPAFARLSHSLYQDTGRIYSGHHSNAMGDGLQQTPSLHSALYQDSNTWNVVILLLQEVKRDIVFWHNNSRSQEDKNNYNRTCKPICSW